ncbi:hypothetical protein [Meleagrid alphaherpesvirus 1]|uniref:LORF5 n=1 Tax=Meleagrid herpesvirus 1 TaxID=37108 RepID=Q9DHC8_MEHV1|nr:protein LORF4A [Meleagrid alphaherpesvirus 1]AKQ48633.1 protein LORF4A [iBAC vector pMeHV1-C7]AKQ48705.1 protein LORF4A [iBAC vector pMeHV1-C9]AKQ48777.1 protein LORF4A [iBAC vector pMeHV1-C10]AKQ48849.1 protein LORF4A [iBAC vector pMeHV1-C17]AKQ48922.1 protein LORF4A [iBAC vector pMeHV1-C18]
MHRHEETAERHSEAEKVCFAPYPSWLSLRAYSCKTSYGIIARPILITDIGRPINIMLTGGWKGGFVTATSLVHQQAILWISELQKPHKPRFISEYAPTVTHAWFLALGTPCFIGKNILPKEVLGFLARRCNEEMNSLFLEMPTTLKTVFEHHYFTRGSEVNPALLMEPNRFLQLMDSRKILCLYESAMCDNPGAQGMILSCYCGRPGGLQCLAFIRTLEMLFNDVLSSKEFVHLAFKCKTNDAFTTLVRAISGPGYAYSITEIDT